MTTDAVAHVTVPTAHAGSFRTALSIGRLHIVTIAALGLLTFGWIFTGKHLSALTVVCACDWFIVNLLNRIVDLKEDRANAIVGTDFVAAHRRAVLAIGFSLLGGSFVVTHLFLPEISPLRIAYHLLGLGYNWPIFGGHRIKELYFFKNTASAVGFMLTVFGYPLAVSAGRLAEGISVGSIVALALFFFLFELSYEVLYDLRDVPGDRAANVRTYPVVHGERAAHRIAATLMFASMVILGAAYALEVVPWRGFVLIAGPALQWSLYIRDVRRGVTAVDCIRMTWIGAVLLALYHLWVALGLPIGD